MLKDNDKDKRCQQFFPVEPQTNGRKNKDIHGQECSCAQDICRLQEVHALLQNGTNLKVALGGRAQQKRNPCTNVRTTNYSML